MSASSPLFTVLIILLCTAIFVLQVLSLAPSVYSVCLSPLYVVSKLQVYRLLSDPFFHVGILHLVLNMLSFYLLNADFENRVGTFGAAYAVCFVIIPFAGISHVLLSFVVDALTGLSTRQNCAIGISGVIFALIVILLEWSNTDDISFFGLFLLPKAVYPWFLLVVLSLLSPSLSFMGHLSGILVGYAMCWGLFAPILLADATIGEWETRWGLRSLPLFKPNPINLGSNGLDSWSRSSSLPSTVTPNQDMTESGNNPSPLSQWFQVLKAWLRGLGLESRSEPFPGTGRPTGTRAGPGIPAHSRLLQERPSSSPAQSVPEVRVSDVLNSPSTREPTSQSAAEDT